MTARSGGHSRRFTAVLLTQSALTQIVTFTLRSGATYRALELNVPTAWLGALGASFAIVPLLLAVPSGQATDRFGEKRIMVAGALLMAGSAVVFVLLGNTVGGLIAGSVVLGTGHLLAVVSQQAAVANTAGAGRFDTAFGHYTFATSLGQAIGPVVIILAGGASALPDSGGTFLAALVLGVLLVVFTTLLRMPTRPQRSQPAGDGGIRTLLRLPGLMRALLISCVVLAAVDISLVYLPALGVARGLASGFIGVLLVLRAVASMGSRLFLGHLVRLVGRKRLMVSSVILSATSMVTMTIPVPEMALGALTVLLGLGLGVGQPLTASWLAEAAPEGLRGRAVSLRVTGNRLGQVLIPTVAGLVAVGVGAAGVLWATAVALGGAAVASAGLASSPTMPVVEGEP